MDEVRLADKYAKALIDCAQQANVIDRLEQELGILTEIFTQQSELRQILLSPIIPVAEKKELLQTIFKKAQISPELESFIYLLLKMRRFNLFGQICQTYKDLIHSLRKRLKVFVQSACVLNARQKAALKRRLSRIYQRNIDLFVQVDPRLIGGAKIYVGHTLFDGTLQTQLNLLREKIWNG